MIDYPHGLDAVVLSIDLNGATSKFSGGCVEKEGFHVYDIFIHLELIYIYIYMLTPPPRAYQNDAQDAKSLCFQPSPMLIFHLILPQN